MKGKLVKFLIAWIGILFLIPALCAKTIVPTLQRVNNPAAKSGNRSASKQSSGAEEQATSPLNEPFTVRYVYPGTEVSKNVVALHITKNGFSICSGLHYHKRWIATAAHCLERFGTATNPRVVVGVEQLANGVWNVGLSEPNNKTPANATIYFYRTGYQSSGAYGHAEDIAIIGLDKNDKLIPLMAKHIKELDAILAHVQQATDRARKDDLLSPEQIQQATSAQMAARKQMTQIIEDKKSFLQQPLDDYHFMTFSSESARLELAGRTAYGYWFEPVIENQVVIDRKLPVRYSFTYRGIPTNNDHTVQWTGQEPGGMSGTPLIIRGYVVGFGSGEGTTALLTDDFTAFLKRYMGADYTRGLCVRSVANEEAITERTQP